MVSIGAVTVTRPLSPVVTGLRLPLCAAFWYLAAGLRPQMVAATVTRLLRQLAFEHGVIDLVSDSRVFSVVTITRQS
ncbi:hypothetical protein ACE1SV_17850 [Streptomyces sennicomposti]